MNAVLLLKYITWHFFGATKSLIQGWGNILWFNYNFFSIGILVRTFFNPWRRITWDYGRGFDIGRYLFVFASNLISRILGAIMRTFLIVAGLAVQVFLIISMIITVCVWIILPALIPFAFAYGFYLLF
jgi:hypothetical protein